MQTKTKKQLSTMLAKAMVMILTTAMTDAGLTPKEIEEGGTLR